MVEAWKYRYFNEYLMNIYVNQYVRQFYQKALSFKCNSKLKGKLTVCNGELDAGANNELAETWVTVGDIGCVWIERQDLLI